MSDDELMQFCAQNEPLNVEREPDGSLLIMTPSNLNTSRKNVYIARMLDEWAEEDGRGVAFDSNGGFTLPDASMRSPDASWLANLKWESLSPEEQERFSHITPDFVIELRSPSDRLRETQRKMEMWIGNGVQLAWLIDPTERVVTIYRPGREPERLDTISQVTGEGPVAGFILPLDRIFN